MFRQTYYRSSGGDFAQLQNRNHKEHCWLRGPRQIENQMQAFQTIIKWLIPSHKRLIPSHLLAWPRSSLTFHVHRNLSAHVMMYDHTEKEGNFGLTHRPVYTLAVGTSANRPGWPHLPAAQGSFLLFKARHCCPFKSAPSLSVPRAPKCQENFGRPGSNSEFKTPPPRKSYPFWIRLCKHTAHTHSPTGPAASTKLQQENPQSAEGSQTGCVHSSPTKAPNRPVTHKRDGAITTSKCRPDGARDGQPESSPAGLRNDIRHAPEQRRASAGMRSNGVSFLTCFPLHDA